MTDAAEPGPVTVDDGREAVRAWFERLQAAVRSVDFEAGRAIVADDVVSFGTKAGTVTGFEHLRANQWAGIWPATEGFTVDLDSLHAGHDGDLAWGVVTWTSTGFDADGAPFDRPGRATVLLSRRDGAWLAIHTHFSLFPGIPQETYGPGGA